MAKRKLEGWKKWAQVVQDRSKGVVAYHENKNAAEKAKHHDQNAATKHDGENPFLAGHETGFPDHLGERLASCWETKRNETHR